MLIPVVLALEIEIDQPGGGVLDIKEFRRIIERASLVGSLVAQQVKTGDLALIPRRIPQLLGATNAVEPNNLGAVTGGPDVIQIGFEAVVDDNTTAFAYVEA